MRTLLRKRRSPPALIPQRSGRSLSPSDHETLIAPHAPPSPGNQVMQAWLQARAIQPKLTVNSPGDCYEEEADRIADEATGPHDPTHVQTKSLRTTAAPDVAPPVIDEALAASGSPLNRAALGFAEAHFGHDLSRVRVHTDAAAARSAAAIAARAYTVGFDVVFGPGQYQPESAAGRRLLAHELTHVIQQTGGAPVRGHHRAARPSAVPANLIQRDTFELDAVKTAACLAKAEEALKELEATAAKPDYPLPDYIKDAITLLRKKMSAGQIKCYSFDGLVHGQFKGEDIRLDGNHLDQINPSNLLHEGVHAGHKEKFPKAGKKYAENEGKQVDPKDPVVQDMLRWKAYTEYWAYRSTSDFYNPSRKEQMPEAEIHKTAMSNPGVRPHVVLVRQFDPDFDPRVWKPKG